MPRNDSLFYFFSEKMRLGVVLWAKLHLHLAGRIPQRRLGCAESQGPEGLADEDQCHPDAVPLSHGHGQESAAVSLRVCALDSGDDPGSAARAVRTSAQKREAQGNLVKLVRRARCWRSSPPN